METKKNITPEAIEEIEKDSQKKQSQENTTKFDTKNYLNVRLDDNETEKELKIRLLPIDKDATSPFKKIFMHTLKVDKKISQSGWKSYVCLEKTGDIDHDKFGTKCPFCELVEGLWKEYNEEKDEIKKKKILDMINENRSSEVCIIRCIERGHEEDGPKFWKFNLRSDGQDPMHSILKIYKTRRQENIEEGDEPGNILDIYDGKDLKITISAVFDKQNKRIKNKTSISITDFGKNKPLSNNEEEIEKWVNDNKKWSDVFVAKPYEYLSIIMDGKIPYFDKNENKWVKKDIDVKESDAKIENEKEIMTAAHEAKSMNDEVSDVNNELPF